MVSYIHLAFTWENNDTKVVFSPVDLLPRNTTVYFNLAAEAATPGGTALGSVLYSEYYTVPPFAVDYTSPAGGPVEYYDGYMYVSMKFTSPVADVPLEEFVTIEPAALHLNVYRSYDGWDISISGFVQPDSTYTVNLSRDLEDIYGQKLGVNYTWTFQVSAARPGFSIPVIQNGGYAVYLEPNEPVVTALATNVGSIDISGGTLDLGMFIVNLGNYSDGLISVEPDNVRRWSQSLNLEPNKSEYLNVPLTPDGGSLATGVYLFKVRAPELDTSNNQYVIPFLTAISNVNITIKSNSKEIFVWAVDYRTGTPLANEEVTFYTPLAEVLGTAVTDGDGMAVFSIPPDIHYDFEDVIAVTGQPGQYEFGITRRNWSAGLNGWDFGIPNYEQQDKPISYIYTDRPIYRPGQEVFFRAVLRNISGWQYSAYEGESVTVKMTGEYDPNIDGVPELGQMTLDVSRFGTISGVFTLAEDAQPGYYLLKVDELDYDASINFKVANYRKPEFEFNIGFGAEELQAGQDIQATVEARYYFGAPAGNLPVSWVLYSASDWFNLPGGFQVGKINNSWLRWDWMYDGLGSLYGMQILTGSGRTDQSCQLILDFDWQDLSQRFDVEALSTLTLEVTGMDESNFTISGRGGVVIHPADRYIGIRPEAWGVQAGSEAGFAIQTVDWEKQPIATQQLTAGFYSVRWVLSEAASPYSYSTYAPEYTEMASTNFGTDQKGSARIAFTPPDPGTYMLEVRGSGAVSQVYVWVGGIGTTEWPNLPYQHLRLEADAENYQPGQTAKIFIPNPFENGALALITVEQDRVQRADVVEIDGPSLLYEIPMTDADAPNVYITVTLIGRLADGRADFRMGIVNLDVQPSAHILNVTLTANPAQAGPGGRGYLHAYS